MRHSRNASDGVSTGNNAYRRIRKTNSHLSRQTGRTISYASIRKASSTIACSASKAGITNHSPEGVLENAGTMKVTAVTASR